MNAQISLVSGPHERIEGVDVLRGFAIFGILLVNMEAFSSAGYRAANGERLWTGTADRIAETLISYGAAGKFIILFSFLFGLSFAIMMERSSARGVAFLPLQGRRLIALLGIGLVHAFLIWYGDILVDYALAGALLLLFRKRTNRTLVVWAILFNLLSFVELEARIVRSTLMPSPAMSVGAMAPTERGSEPTTPAGGGPNAYGRRDVAGIMRQRAHDAWAGIAELYNNVPRRLAFFLIGLLVWRLGLVADIARRRRWLWRMGAGALMVGGAAHIGSFVLSLQQMPPWARVLRLPMSIVGNPAIALVYTVGVALLFGTRRGCSLLSPLGAVGRTALSNYLLQSLVCTAIFYGYGLGLYGRLGPAAGMAVSVGIFALEVVASRWWLRWFQYGPAEWLWRSATYWRRQPFLVRARTA